MSMRKVFVLAILFLSKAVVAQNDVWLSQEAQNCLNDIYTGNSLTKLYDCQPPERYYLSTYKCFYDFISFENEESVKAFHDAFDEFSKYHSDNETEQTRLMLANLCIQKGLMQWMNQSYLPGMFAFLKGYRLLEDEVTLPHLNQEKQKLRALFLIFIDQLPDYASSGVNLLGLKGDEYKGFEELRAYVDNAMEHPGIYSEALVLYTYCLLKFSDLDTVSPDTISLLASQHPSALLKFVSVSLMLKLKQGGQARRLLQDCSDMQLSQFPLLLHLKGKALLNAMDPDAERALLNFIKQYPGSSFKADAHLRLAWCYRLQYDTLHFKKHLKYLSEVTHLLTSYDKQAQSEWKDIESQPLDLLKARLLYDDGEYNKSISILKKKGVNDYSAYYQAEWHYRLGRNYEAIKQYKEALSHYEKVINLTTDDDRYIGPYSALNSAKISLKVNRDTSKTRQMLEIADELNDGLYKADIKREVRHLSEQIEQ